MNEDTHRDTFPGEHPAERGVLAGFPSPAEDCLHAFIDLNRELVHHPAATFYARVTGNAMVDAGVGAGDVLVIDKALEPSEGDMAVCFIDGEFVLGFLSFKAPETPSSPVSGTMRKASRPGVSYDILQPDKMWLLPAKTGLCGIEISEANDFTVWGIVTYVIKKVCTRW